MSAKTSASAQELLINGGFETGDLTGWAEEVGAGEGHVVSVSGSAVQPCQRIDPNVPRTGGFLFSASTADGATPGTPSIVISQSVDVSGLPVGSTIEARGYFSGSPGCANPSNDLVTLVREFYGNGGTSLVGTRTYSTRPRYSRPIFRLLLP